MVEASRLNIYEVLTEGFIGEVGPWNFCVKSQQGGRILPSMYSLHDVVIEHTETSQKP